MKKFITVLSIVAILGTAFLGKLKRQDSSEVLLEVFNQSAFETIQSNINTYAILDQPIKNIEDMEQYFKAIDKKIAADYEYQLIKEQKGSVNTLSRVYISNNQKWTLKLETQCSETPNTYIVLDVILYNCNNQILTVKESLDKLFRNLNVENKTNISITGIYKGNMSTYQKKLTTIDIMKNIHAITREDYVTDEVYSVVGYTNKIREYIYSGKRKININLALRYNSYEDKTYLYLATPVITVEY